MRAHVLSDVHFEHMSKDFGEEFYRNLAEIQAQQPAKLLILAGDICQIGQHEFFWRARLKELCRGYDKVLYVPGNHEYYRTNFYDVDAFLESIDQDDDFSNFIQLEHGPYVYDGQRFIGGTMWFPDDHATNKTAKRWMNDFRVIQNFEPEVYRRHRQFLVKVAAQLRAGDVVVTHHMPTPACIRTKYIGSDLNPFFMANMTPYLYEGTLPKLWIFGHTHDPVEEEHVVGSQKMKLFANPHGYPHEGANPVFWSRIVVDIS